MKRILNNNLLYYLIAQISVFVIGILKVPFLTYLFKPEEIGNYTLIVSLLSYIEIIFLSWISSTFWRYIYEGAIIKRFMHLLSIIIPMFFIVFVIGFILVLGFALYFHSNVVLYRLAIFGYLYIISQQVFLLFLLYLQSGKQIKKWSVFLVLQQVASFILLMVLAETSTLSIVSIYVSSLAVNILFIILLFFYYNRILKKVILPNVAEFKMIIFYSSSSVLVNVLLLVLNNADRFIISYFKGAKELGIYAQSYSLASVGFFSAIQAFSTVFLPFYNKSVVTAVEPETNSSIIQLYLILVTPITVLLILNSEIITVLMLAPDFRGLHHVFSIVIGGLYFYGFANFLEIRLKLLNRINQVIILLLLIAGFNVIANLLLIPDYGVFSAGIITLISYFSLFSFLIFLNWNFVERLHLKPFMRQMLIVSVFIISLHWLLSFLTKEISLPTIFIFDIAITMLITFLLMKKHQNVVMYCYKLVV